MLQADAITRHRLGAVLGFVRAHGFKAVIDDTARGEAVVLEIPTYSEALGPGEPVIETVRTMGEARNALGY